MAILGVPVRCRFAMCFGVEHLCFEGYEIPTCSTALRAGFLAMTAHKITIDRLPGMYRLYAYGKRPNQRQRPRWGLSNCAGCDGFHIEFVYNDP